MIDKRITLEAALDMLPEGPFTLGLGGATLYRRPMAFVLALIARHRQRPIEAEITLLNFTAGLESDLLVGQGLIDRVRTCYFGLEAFGFAPRFSEAAARGELAIIEETEASLAFGLRATLAGVGFMPSQAWLGTDLPQLRPDVQQVTDPYSGEALTAFPAIRCDYAVVHALEADLQGNADIGANWGIDRELAFVSETVVITAERIVPRLERANLLGQVVTAVVEAPRGAWPTSCHPEYGLDGAALLEYVSANGEGEELLERWLAGP